MKSIRRLKSLNAIVTSLFIAFGLFVFLMAGAQYLGQITTIYNLTQLIIVGALALLVAWIINVLQAFIIEWAENTYLLRLSYEDLRKTIAYITPSSRTSLSDMLYTNASSRRRLRDIKDSAENPQPIATNKTKQLAEEKLLPQEPSREESLLSLYSPSVALKEETSREETITQESPLSEVDQSFTSHDKETQKGSEETEPDMTAHTEVEQPQRKLDKQLLQQIYEIEHHRDATSAGHNEMNNKNSHPIPFDIALRQLSKGLAVANHKFKLQKHIDGKIIIGYKTNEDYVFEYIAYSSVVAQLYDMQWNVVENSDNILWKSS